MFTNRLREWVRARPRPLRAALVEAWNTAGVRTGEPGDQPVVRLGRAAAVLRPDGRVETTAFMRQHPLVQSMDEGMHEAAWAATGGAVFNDRAPTGNASPLDSGGMHAAAGGWADLMGTLRLRLLAREEQSGLLPWLEDGPARSADFGWRAVPGRRIEAALARELSALLSEEFTVAASEALRAWRSRMPERLLLAMDDAGWNSPDRWNWLVSDLRRPQPRRLQALEAFPWASEALRSGSLLKVVDGGQPLADALAAVHGVSPAAVRRLRGMPASETTPPPLALSMAARSAEGGHAMPRTRGGWACWGSAAAAARRRGVTGIAGAGWDDVDASRFLRAMENLEDAARDLEATLLRPLRVLLGEAAPEPEAMERACIWASPQRAVETVEAWMRDDGEARRSLVRDWPIQGGQPPSEPWPALHEPWDSGYGLRAFLLVDEDQLAGESRRMGHCVRDYGRRCRLSGVHIVSWRDGEGRSVATQELSQEGVLELPGTRTEAFTPSRGLPPGTIQLQGPRNVRASDKAFLAAWAHASALATGALSVQSAALRDALGMRQLQGGETGRAAAGWDLAAPGAARAALRAYAPILPKKARESLEKALRSHEGMIVAHRMNAG